MAEIAKKRAEIRVGKRREKGISSFVVLAIVLSVLAVLVVPVTAPIEPGFVTGIVLSANPEGIPADGSSISNITANVTYEESDFASGFNITFEITSGPVDADLTKDWDYPDDPPSPANAYTDLIAGTTPGDVTVIACWNKGQPDQVVSDPVTVTLLPPPTLTPWNNITKDALTEVTINESECVYFNATADQPIDTWSWFVDGVNQTHDFDEFTRCWAVGGEYSVAVNATNANGTSDTITWTVTVEDHTPPASITYLVNTTGNFWINWTWTNPLDDDYSRVMVYIDGSHVTDVTKPRNWYNVTYEQHATKTIATNTVDTSGNVNEAWENQTTTIPNNAPVLEPIGPKSVLIGQPLTIDVDATDLDDTDTLAYSCNRTDLFTNFNPATGIGSWTPSAAGTYYVDFGVSDGYGGIDNETVKITVFGFGVDLTATPEEQTVAPNEIATYTLTVENTGTVADDYTLSVDNVTPADIAELDIYGITALAAGATQDVSLTVRDADEGTYIVNVTVTGTDVSDEVMTKTIVSAMGSITGKITYTCNETGIAGVTVNLTEDGDLVDSVVTDGNGDYEFSGVTPGDYYVNVSKTMFRLNSTYVTVSAGTETVNMMLWLEGDLNNDCHVGWDDFLLFADAYGSHVGDPNYNALADLNNDGEVGWDDFLMFADVYGT